MSVSGGRRKRESADWESLKRQSYASRDHISSPSSQLVFFFFVVYMFRSLLTRLIHRFQGLGFRLWLLGRTFLCLSVLYGLVGIYGLISRSNGRLPRYG